MAFAEVQVKWSAILMDRLGPDIFSALRMKDIFTFIVRVRI